MDMEGNPGMGGQAGAPEVMIHVADIRPNSRRINVIIKVLNKGEVREGTSKDGKPYRVTEALVGDDTGTVLLSLWNEMIDKIEVGKTYKVSNGYASTFMGHVRLNVGLYGKLDVSETEIASVNEGNNISDIKHQEARRFGGARQSNFNRFGRF